MNNHRNTEYLALFGKHLKTLRLEKGLTQSLLADKSNIERSQIVRIEKGLINPTLTTLKVIADNLEVELVKLVNF